MCIPTVRALAYSTPVILWVIPARARISYARIMVIPVCSGLCRFCPLAWNTVGSVLPSFSACISAIRRASSTGGTGSLCTIILRIRVTAHFVVLIHAAARWLVALCGLLYAFCNSLTAGRLPRKGNIVPVWLPKLQSSTVFARLL